MKKTVSLTILLFLLLMLAVSAYPGITWDNFNGASINSTLWVGSATESGGVLTINGGNIYDATALYVGSRKPLYVRFNSSPTVTDSEQLIQLGYGGFDGTNHTNTGVMMSFGNGFLDVWRRNGGSYSGKLVASPGLLSGNTWYWVMFNLTTSNDMNFTIYSDNATNIGNQLLSVLEADLDYWSNPLTLSMRDTSGNSIVLVIDEIDVNTTGAGGGGSGPQISELVLTATDAYTGAAVSNLSANISNATTTLSNSTAGSTLKFGGVVNLTNYKINLTSTGYYLGNSSTNVTINLSTSAALILAQAYLIVNFTSTLGNASIQTFAVKTNLTNVSASGGLASFPVSAGNIAINITSPGLPDLRTSTTVAAMTSSTLYLYQPYVTVQYISAYSGLPIQNFTVVTNQSAPSNLNNSATGIATLPVLAGSLQVNVSALGYRNQTAVVTAVANANTFVNFTQAFATIHLTSSFTGNSIMNFSLVTNQGHSVNTGTGNITIAVDAGSIIFNLTSPGFQNYSRPETISAGSNNTFTYIMGARATYYIIDENSLQPFNVGATNFTRMDFICSNQSASYTFTTSSLDAITPCFFSYLKLTVNYVSANTTATYFRTIIPGYDTANVYFFMVDLSQPQYTIVQSQVSLKDLTGEFNSGIIRIKKPIQNATGIYNTSLGYLAEIISQPFDITQNTYLYLLKDANYVVEIENSQGDVRSLGNMVAAQAVTQTISLPSISFWPEHTALQTAVVWNYNFSTDAGILRLSYSDSQNLTTSFVLNIYNVTNTSQLLWTYSAPAYSASIVATYNGVVEGQSYLTVLDIMQVNAGPIHEAYVWGVGEAAGAKGEDNLTDEERGFSEATLKNILRWVALGLICVVALLFTAGNVAPGIAIMAVMLWILRAWHWIPDEVNNYKLGMVTAILALLAVLTWWDEQK